ncbi:MAG: hypothetical protein MZV70_14275 [Desulfobacterales bacterium]|nr:hypothetical protein [Desulfobacterales bacterium]
MPDGDIDGLFGRMIAQYAEVTNRSTAAMLAAILRDARIAITISAADTDRRRRDRRARCRRPAAAARHPHPRGGGTNAPDGTPVQ